MKKILLFVLILIMSGHAAMAKTKVNFSIEILPNVVHHIFTVSEIWDFSPAMRTYVEQYKNTISQADRDFVSKHRELIRWGNGKTGLLTSLLFFVPLRHRVESKKDIAEYFDQLLKSYSEDDFSSFSHVYPNPISSGENVRELIKHKRRYIRILENFRDIYLRTYENYQRYVWPEEKTKLEQIAAKLRSYFYKRDVIARWEKLLKQPYPYDEFTVVMTSSNPSRAPSANNLSNTRDNFYYMPNDFESLRRMISHEIGIYALAEYSETLWSDKELAKQLEPTGNVQEILYLASESFAEYCNGQVLGIAPAAWEGKTFSGTPYDFPFFFSIYDHLLHSKQHISPYEMMKEAALMYAKKKKVGY